MACAQVDPPYGCCVGNDLYYCETAASAVTTKACTGADVCGWSASQSIYDCVPPPSAPDPSGTHPIACE